MPRLYRSILLLVCCVFQLTGPARAQIDLHLSLFEIAPSTVKVILNSFSRRPQILTGNHNDDGQCYYVANARLYQLRDKLVVQAQVKALGESVPLDQGGEGPFASVWLLNDRHAVIATGIILGHLTVHTYDWEDKAWEFSLTDPALPKEKLQLLKEALRHADSIDISIGGSTC